MTQKIQKIQNKMQTKLRKKIQKIPNKMQTKLRHKKCKQNAKTKPCKVLKLWTIQKKICKPLITQNQTKQS